MVSRQRTLKQCRDQSNGTTNNGNDKYTVAVAATKARANDNGQANPCDEIRQCNITSHIFVLASALAIFLLCLMGTRASQKSLTSISRRGGLGDHDYVATYSSVEKKGATPRKATEISSSSSRDDYYSENDVKNDQPQGTLIKTEDLNAASNNQNDYTLLRKNLPIINPDRSKGERPSASVAPPLKLVDMKRWGYVSRPRVVSCEFGVFSNGDDLRNASLAVTSVVRLPDFEPNQPLSSNRYVTPYPDDDEYIGGLEDVKQNSRKYQIIQKREPLNTGTTCVFKHNWQTAAYPNCNIIHEFDLGSKQVIYWTHGSVRDVWSISVSATGSTPKKEENTVMKTLRYQLDFSYQNYDRHRQDALASMRLSGSPNVVDIFAHCSNSAIFESGDTSFLRDTMSGERNNVSGKYWFTATLSSLEKIDIAYQVARAIADIHDVEDDGLVSISHADISPAQFIYIDGRYKISDFNNCVFMRINKSDNSPCGFFRNWNSNQLSPEEYAKEELNEMIDVYAMGKVFYVLLSGQLPFFDVEPGEAKKSVMNGERATIPHEVLTSNDVTIQAIISATKQCWEQNPKNRPSALEIRDELKLVMDRIQLENAA